MHFQSKCQVYEGLNPISPMFTIARSSFLFSLHLTQGRGLWQRARGLQGASLEPRALQNGVFEAGNVVLRPELLGEFQAYAEKKTGEAKARRFLRAMRQFMLQIRVPTGSLKDKHRSHA